MQVFWQKKTNLFAFFAKRLAHEHERATESSVGPCRTGRTEDTQTFF